MSPPPHREMPARVEGRDPPEKAKETMTPFRSLLGRLLRVPMSEVREQQEAYEDLRSVSTEPPSDPAKKREKDKQAKLITTTEKAAKRRTPKAQRL